MIQLLQPRVWLAMSRDLYACLWSQENVFDSGCVSMLLIRLCRVLSALLTVERLEHSRMLPLPVKRVTSLLSKDGGCSLGEGSVLDGVWSCLVGRGGL